MKFSLIVCTYMRPQPLSELLQSVKKQTMYPNEILIVDGSKNEETKILLQNNIFENMQYFKVTDKDRGLTRQRNLGISKLSSDSEIVCFLDDDTILEPNYFEELLKTYSVFPHALGVGGYITNEITWEKADGEYKYVLNEFYFDGWKRKDGSRFILRKKLHLDSNCPPGFLPMFSHGRSIGFLPPTNKIYQVEQLMGGVSSFRKIVFENFSFSNYFEGYGLYEDADFTLRVAKTGKLYINTAAKLAHYHAETGRPNQYQYGKMVVRNGWYIWRIKNPNPSFSSKFKWNAITSLLILIRLTNILTSKNKKEVCYETLGRIFGYLSLLINKPLKNRK